MHELPIGPMHEENILGNTPKIPIASFSFSLLKVGIPLVKINIFQRFKYRKNRADTLKNKSKTRQLVLLGRFTKIFSSCIGPILSCQFLSKNLFL